MTYEDFLVMCQDDNVSSAEILEAACELNIEGLGDFFEMMNQISVDEISIVK